MINLSKESGALNNALTAILVDLCRESQGKEPEESVIFVQKNSDYSATVYYDDLLNQYAIYLTRKQAESTKGEERNG